MNKPSTRLHEVFNPKFNLIVFCGSQNACVRYAGNKPAEQLVVRPAAR
jgi:hypothetical protein